MNKSNKPTVAVVMSTYNGEKYLSEQIDSILSQIDVNIQLYIRDDGSSDKSIEILNKYNALYSCIHVDIESNVGVAKSFFSELLSIITPFEYYAFSDQDDYWEKEKLISGIRLLQETEKKNRGFPALYYSNLKITAEDLTLDHITSLHKRTQTLESVMLRQSIAGCTMIFNKFLVEKLRLLVIDDMALLFGHDSFLISLTYALNGIIICDKNAYIRYRQHGNNTSGGTPLSIKDRLRKEKKTRKKIGGRAGIAKVLLDQCKNDLSPNTQSTLQCIVKVSGKNLRSVMARFQLIFNPKFTTGDWRLTVYSKLLILFGMY